MDKDYKKENFEDQFKELFEKAKQIYPDIEDSVATLNNITAKTTDVQDYLNLTMKAPSEMSSNQISLV